MRKSPSSSQKGPSQRQLKVGELLRHSLAECFTREEVYDDVIGSFSVTISEVRVSPDLRHATVFIVPAFQSEHSIETLLEALGRHAPRIRTLMAQRVRLRYVPQLTFRTDNSFEYADKIETLIKSVSTSQPPEETESIQHVDSEY